MLGALEHLAGAALLLLLLADVFLWVLYARAGAGIVSQRLARGTWKVFRATWRPGTGRRGSILSYCGPAILVLLVLTWGIGLTIATALILHPALGGPVRSAGGRTPTDFVTAMLAAGGSLSIVRTGDFTPYTSAYRLLYILLSLIGVSVLSLTITYVLQVYNTLKARNVVGFQLHLLSAETDDAAEVLAGLGAQGRFQSGYTDLSALASQVAAVKEAHHFYPVLFYFRFHETYYSASQIALVSLDAASLIKAALDDGRYAWLKESAAVTQLWRASMILVATLERVFLADATPRRASPPDPRTAERWRRRFTAALHRLRAAGIETIADEEEGAEVYASLRAQWEPALAALAPATAYRLEEIDPAGQWPETAEAARPEFAARMHGVG